MPDHLEMKNAMLRALNVTEELFDEELAKIIKESSSPVTQETLEEILPDPI